MLEEGAPAGLVLLGAFADAENLPITVVIDPRSLQTKAGEIRLKVPKLRQQNSERIFMVGPAAATKTMSRLGLWRARKLTGTSLA